MHKIERHSEIMRLLNGNGCLVVSDVCELLGCSDQTVRRDLQELEEQGKLKRVHGGAFIPDPDDHFAPVRLRARLVVEEKNHMAQLAADRYISDGDTIMLDASTTCDTLARLIISSGPKTTIITNSFATVSEYAGSESESVLIATGGRFRRSTASVEGPDAVSSISAHVADKAFISCNAVSREFGMLDNYEYQRDVRLAMLSHAREKYLIIDHTKFDDRANVVISDFANINGVITDREPDDDWKAFFDGLGISVIWQ